MHGQQLGAALRCAAVLAAEGLHCIRGWPRMHRVAVVAADSALRDWGAQVAVEGWAVLQWWRMRAGLHWKGGTGSQGLHRVAVVAAEGLHCTGGS